MTALALIFLATELPEPDLSALAEAGEKRFLWDPCGEYRLNVRETNDIAVATTTIAAEATARLEGDRWTLTGTTAMRTRTRGSRPMGASIVHEASATTP